MEVSATLRYLRMSPRKVRVVADAIRRMRAVDAEYQLQFMSRDASEPMLKLLRSAIANAENNNELKKENLFVRSVFVNQGPTLKRFRARAFGRAAEIRKRSSHITIVLDELKPSKQPSALKKSATVSKSKKKSTEARPVVDYKDIKREAKGPEQKREGGEVSEPQAKQHQTKAAGKETFSRRLGDS